MELFHGLGVDGTLVKHSQSGRWQPAMETSKWVSFQSDLSISTADKKVNEATHLSLKKDFIKTTYWKRDPLVRGSGCKIM